MKSRTSEKMCNRPFVAQSLMRQPMSATSFHLSEDVAESLRESKRVRGERQRESVCVCVVCVCVCLCVCVF